MSVTRVLCVSALIVCYHSVSATGIGSSCTDNSNCMAVANAICGNMICICPENFVASASNNKCIRLLKHYDNCEESVQCSHSNEMECRDNKCQCKTNFQYDGVQCLGSLGLGQECDRDSECLDSSDPKQRTVWCYGKQCACRNGFQREGTRCVVGGDCTHNSDCDQLENSFCNKLMRDRYQCTCQENYVPAANNTKCLPIARHYEMCEESHQCTYSTETECQGSICRCSMDTEYKEGHCVLRQVGIGGSCSVTDDCRDVNDAVCLNRVCTCITNFVPAPDNRCLPKVNHSESCTESIQCEDLIEAECVDGTCQCRSGFNFNGRRCVGNIGLGQECSRDVECVVAHDLLQETVWCFNRQCSCRNGYRRELGRCVIGGDCTTDEDCRNLTNSRCDTRARDRSQCACSPGFLALANNTRCLQIRDSIGGGCEFDEQCSTNLGSAVCANFQCACAEGTSWQNDNTCAFNRTCVTDDDCRQLGNSYCDKRVQDKYQCACRDGFIFVANNSKCLPIRDTIGSECEYDEQCSPTLGNAVCGADKRCKCADGVSVKSDNTCGAAGRILLSLSCFVLVWMVKLL